MSREIKFRVWDTACGEPSMLQWKDLQKYSVDCVFLPTIAKQAIMMQYTGLKDKNGKEIYEGDILYNRAFDIPEEEIIYNVVRWINTSYSAYFDFGTASACHLVEIVGNIYGNPELMEASNHAK